MKHLLQLSSVTLLVLTLTACSQETPQWKAVKKTVEPHLVSKEVHDISPLLAKKFSKKLFSTFADIDTTENRINPVHKLDIMQYGVDAEALEKRAQVNLENRVKQANIQVAIDAGTPENAYIIIEEINASAFLLSSKARRTFEQHLGERYIVAVPLQDILIAWHKDFPLQNEFITQVHDEFNAGGDYALSTELFVVEGDEVEAMMAITE